MGFTPQQVGAMSFWQFMACADGFARARQPDAPVATDEDLDAAADLLDAAPTYLQ